MARLEIKTSIQISASPAKVWAVLTDFSKYEEWNPFLKSMKGNFKAGERVAIEADGMKFKPLVLAYEENKELRWLGNLLFKGLFDGEHIFKLIGNNDGTTTFLHEENFRGILVGILAHKLQTETKAAFEAMNSQLKHRVETMNSLAR